MGTVVGIDVGYSNLKVVAGDNVTAKPKKELLMPAGAGPAEKMPRPVSDNGSAPKAGVSVLIDNTEWVAGVEPGRLQAHERALDRNYTRSKQYQALFYGALASLETDHIGHLVTGLPVTLHEDLELRGQLSRFMTGRHEIAKGRTVAVDKVSVIPQPVGAYMSLLSEIQDIDLIDGGRILILDPGFFSLDWVVVEKGEIRTALSNSSYSAISRVLELVHDRIHVNHSARVGISTLESALRHGEHEIYARGNKINFDRYLNEAAVEVLTGALQAVQRSMRTEDRDVDLVMLAGGGARIIEAAAREAFPGVRIEIPNDPVLANARGYWYYGI